MLLSGPDYSLLRQDGPTRFSIERRNSVLHRGLNELRPHRFSMPKLVASVARQLAYRSAEPVTGVSVLMPLANQADAEEMTTALIGLPNVDIFPALIPNLFQQLGQLKGRRVVVVVGDGDLPPAAPFLRLSHSLALQSPQLEQRFCQELVATFGKAHGELVPAGFERSRLIVEERPGKAVPLHVAEPTLKALGKSWQTLAQRPIGEVAPQPLSAPSGWGIGGALLVEDQDHSSSPTLLRAAESFAALSVRMASDEVQLDTGRILRELAAAWLAETADFDVSMLRRLIISVPWMAAAATISSGFAMKGSPFPALCYPDFLHGWQPPLTAFELLSPCDGPVLLLHLGRYPEVHMAAKWI